MRRTLKITQEKLNGSLTRFRVSFVPHHSLIQRWQRRSIRYGSAYHAHLRPDSHGYTLVNDSGIIVGDLGSLQACRRAIAKYEDPTSEDSKWLANKVAVSCMRDGD